MALAAQDECPSRPTLCTEIYLTSASRVRRDLGIALAIITTGGQVPSPSGTWGSKARCARASPQTQSGPWGVRMRTMQDTDPQNVPGPSAGSAFECVHARNAPVLSDTLRRVQQRRSPRCIDGKKEEHTASSSPSFPFVRGPPGPRTSVSAHAKTRTTLAILAREAKNDQKQQAAKSR
ncbi:hypothetical protein CONPUDRAFT_166484 [Coniophora puteana RWD-64-598 SS2]|uniref:Uncharacterized protein n=1 Tax=Coniophora puteana (strain RWD-64-598) TaxID=741705 RepID=A0A5M3MMG2_CONPW|nr:uncharacterized protein CONPUDRAFT_166484 [Coniophora puteana RWD-64-598 SS2]EIW79781.1 hypothetical protein CONPUDRAFT_166484 [Coniophora puteana RWD-64-598 SS2]